MIVRRLVRSHRSLPWVLGAWGCFLLVGCGGEPKPTTDQAAVTGSVTYDGKPVPLDSSVVFYCADHAATAAGKVDSLGKFQLAASIPRIGIPAGRYQVMIRPPAPPTANVSDEASYAQLMQPKKTTAEEGVKEIPKQFMALATSKLVFELKAGPNNFDLDLAKLSK
jgi:hypothetical protein